MRCVPDLFKHHLPDVARTLVTAFQQHQHSTYLYSAEVLARTYAKDPENVPVLTELFNQLSGIGLQSLVHSEDKLEEIRELAEARESIPAILQPWAFTMARQLYESELQEARSSLAKLQAELQEAQHCAKPNVQVSESECAGCVALRAELCAAQEEARKAGPRRICRLVCKSAAAGIN
eukprot:g6768.t1